MVLLLESRTLFRNTATLHQAQVWNVFQQQTDLLRLHKLINSRHRIIIVAASYIQQLWGKCPEIQYVERQNLKLDKNPPKAKLLEMPIPQHLMLGWPEVPEGM